MPLLKSFSFCRTLTKFHFILIWLTFQSITPTFDRNFLCSDKQFLLMWQIFSLYWQIFSFTLTDICLCSNGSVFFSHMTGIRSNATLRWLPGGTIWWMSLTQIWKMRQWVELIITNCVVELIITNCVVYLIIANCVIELIISNFKLSLECFLKIYDWIAWYEISFAQKLLCFFSIATVFLFCFSVEQSFSALHGFPRSGRTQLFHIRLRKFRRWHPLQAVPVLV